MTNCLLLMKLVTVEPPFYFLERKETTKLKVLHSSLPNKNCMVEPEMTKSLLQMDRLLTIIWKVTTGTT